MFLLQKLYKVCLKTQVLIAVYYNSISYPVLAKLVNIVVYVSTIFASGKLELNNGNNSEM